MGNKEWPKPQPKPFQPGDMRMSLGEIVGGLGVVVLVVWVVVKLVVGWGTN